MTEQSSYLEQLDASISRIENFVEIWIKQQGLSYNTFAIFYTLAKKTTCTQKQIADEWFLPKQTVFSICKTLVCDGLLVMQDNPKDKRERLLSLTEKGKAYAIPLVKQADEFADKIFEIYGEQRIQTLLSEMNALSDVAENFFAKNKP